MGDLPDAVYPPARDIPAEVRGPQFLIQGRFAVPIIFYRRDGRWDTEHVSEAPGYLSLAPVRFEPSAETGDGEFRGDGLLARSVPHGGRVLLVRRGVRLLHNGQRIAAGVRVLAHRDALSLDGGDTVYFSTEEPARSEPFTGPANTTCPRCRSEVLPGQPAVRCPGCSVFYHETEERNCWTYTPACAGCAHPTAFDSEPQWTPETL